MKKLFLILLAVAVVGVSFCSQSESPEAGFKKFQEAACQSNADEFLSRIDSKSLLVSFYKEENPKATDADIQAFKDSKEFNEKLRKGDENFKKIISDPNNEFCKVILKTVKSEGDTAKIHVQENPDNPYYVFVYAFKKAGNKWILSSMDGFVNPPLYISSKEIDKDYAANAVAADQKYKGKVITIKGKINQIGKDITDKVFITLGDGLLGDVQCYIKSSHIQKVANLKAGDVIEITGIGNGKLIIPDVVECVF